MSTQRQRDRAELNARVAVEAIQGHQTVHECASPWGVHPTPLTHWNQPLQPEVPHMVSARRAQREHDAGSPARPGISTNRATHGGGGLVEQTRGRAHLRPGAA